MNEMINKDEFLTRNEGKASNYVPFVGAGFSAMLQYEDGSRVFPAWDQFNYDLLNDIGQAEIFDRLKTDPEDIAEYYIRCQALGDPRLVPHPVGVTNPYFRHGKKKFMEFTKRRLKVNLTKNGDYKINDKRVLHLEPHLALSKFPYIYTTNWDQLLESVVGYTTIYRNAQLNLPEVGSREKIVIKFHGHIDTDVDDHDNPLICCKTDYMNRIMSENPFDIMFKNDLLHKDFIFAGYSFRDPNILLVLYQISQLMRSVQIGSGTEFHSKIYWLTTDHNKDPRLYTFNSMNIISVDLLTDENKNELNELAGSDSAKCDSENCSIDLTSQNPKEFCKNCTLKKETESNYWKRYNEIRYEALKSVFDSFVG